ncbi:MAG: anthranilate phosphoribosyltransferase [Rikenellaceae bacterium]
MKSTLTKLFRYENLDSATSRELLHNIARGEYNQAQIAALMSIFLMRPITLEELSGFREALMELRTPISFGDDEYIDIVGTGGDGKDTFNISTCSSIVVAAAGYRVVKHGNYGASSISGASNVMESHGVKFTADNDALRRSLDGCNLAYLHAPLFNSALKAVAEVRRNFGLRNFFNMLGPTLNPAEPKYQLLGVYNLEMLRLYNYLFQRMDRDYAVVHSLDGYDEISLTKEFKVSSKHGERIYAPEELGFSRACESDLFGGESIEDASAIFDSVLNGSSSTAQRDCVIANAAFAITVIDPAKSIEEAIAIARETIDSSRASETLKQFIKLNS